MRYELNFRNLVRLQGCEVRCLKVYKTRLSRNVCLGAEGFEEPHGILRTSSRCWLLKLYAHGRSSRLVQSLAGDEAVHPPLALQT